MHDEEFLRRYETFERKAVEDFLSRFAATKAEVCEAINYLIEQREKLRDEQLALLEQRASRLILTLQGVEQQRVLEEVACFRDVLALHRRLLAEHDRRS